MDLTTVERNVQKLTSTLEAYKKRCSAMKEMMKWKKDEALKEVEADMNQLKRRLDEILLETQHKVETEVGAIVERLKDAAVFLTASLAEVKQAMIELECAKGESDTEALMAGVKLLLSRVENGAEEQCGRPIRSHVNFDVVENCRFSSVLRTLRSDRLHYIKCGANMPSELRFSLVPSQNCTVGNDISLEIRLQRSDADCLEFLKVQVRNETHNVALVTKIEPKQPNIADVFVFTFLAELEGRHVVEAFLYDEPIANSPLTLLIENSNTFEQRQHHQPSQLFDLSACSAAASNSFNFDRLLSQSVPVFAAPTTLQSLRRQAPSADKISSPTAAERSATVSSPEKGANLSGELETSEGAKTSCQEPEVKELANETEAKLNVAEEKRAAETTAVTVGGYGRGAPLSRSIDRQPVRSAAGKGEASASNFGMASVRSALETVDAEENWDVEPSANKTAQDAPNFGDSVGPEFKKDIKMRVKPVEDEDRRRRGSARADLKKDAVKGMPTGFPVEENARKRGGEEASSQNLKFDGNAVGGEMPNLVDMFNKFGAKGLHGRLVKVFGVPGKGDKPAELAYIDEYFLRPIGCNRSEHTADWIVCDTDHNIVKLFDGKFEPNLLIKHASEGHTPFLKPSAVATFNSGTKMLIKDDRRIAAFELVGEDAGVVLGQLTEHNKMMGLAVTGDKAVTLVDAFLGKGAEIHVYDIETCVGGRTGQPLCRFPYASICGDGGDSKPRFIDVQRDRLIVTDLGQNKVSAISLRDGQLIGQFGKQGRRFGEFNFVSGVRLDGAGNLLIGDAKNNRIQLFDSEGQFVCVLTLDQPGAGFVSDLHLTPDGHVMICNRGQHYCAVFKLVSPPR